MKYDKLFGDMFVMDKLIFRIYDNEHPKNKIIAYPIYEMNNNYITRPKNKNKILKKYLKKIGSNLYLPVIDEDKVEIYFSCFDFKLNKNDKLQKVYSYVKNRLNAIGVNNIGITGSNYLKLKGFKVGNKDSDLDLIVSGKKEAILLEKNKDKLYDSKFVSYEKYQKKIYLRRKNKTSPFFIDFKTAKEFESVKTIGLIKNTHINITPTYKIENKKDDFKNNDNMGVINVKVEIIDITSGNTVPGFYKIKCRHKEYNISKLKSNFFFYLLGAKKGDVFDIKGNLMKKRRFFKDEYFLELNSWGDYKYFFMNKLN